MQSYTTLLKDDSGYKITAKGINIAWPVLVSAGTRMISIVYSVRLQLGNHKLRLIIIIDELILARDSRLVRRQCYSFVASANRVYCCNYELGYAEELVGLQYLGVGRNM